MLTVLDIPRNDVAAALAVVLDARAHNGLPPGHGAILMQLQRDPTEYIEARRILRETGEIPAQYRERVQALLAKSAA